MAIFIAVTALIPVPLIISLLLLRRYQHKAKLFALCLLLQVITFVTVVYAALEGAGDAAHFGAGFAALVVAVVLSAILIPGVFAALIFFTNKPEGWQRKIAYVAAPYIILLAIFVVLQFV